MRSSQLEWFALLWHPGDAFWGELLLKDIGPLGYLFFKATTGQGFQLARPHRRQTAWLQRSLMMRWRPWIGPLGRLPAFGESKSSNYFSYFFRTYVRSKTHLVSCWYWVSTSLLKRDRYNPLLEYRISLSQGVQQKLKASKSLIVYIVLIMIYDIAINKRVVEPVCNQVCDVAHVYMYIHLTSYYTCK